MQEAMCVEGCPVRTPIPQMIELCDEIMAGTDDAVPGDFLGRPALYAKKKDPFFRRFDGGIANIAYSRDRIWKKQVTPPDVFG